MTDPDEAWIARARERLARGEDWEHPLGAPALETLVARAPVAAAVLRCPYCKDHPALEIYSRREAVSRDPLYYCRRCCGFWATGDALSRGVADEGDETALFARTALRRCRECGGHLREDDSCVSCGRTPPSQDCPECRRPMTRSKRKGVTIDICDRGHGAWFDMGELALAYGLQPPQGLAASTVDEHATDDDPPAWQLAAELLLRLFLPFL